MVAKMPSRTLPMASTTRAATEADLLRTPRDGRKYELVDGEIRVSPAGSRHGVVSLEIAARLLAFVKGLPGGNVRSPDASFVARGALRWRSVVYRSLSDVRQLGPGDELDGQDVLPGFRCRLQDILE
jgi:hypothetical protein